MLVRLAAVVVTSAALAGPARADRAPAPVASQAAPPPVMPKPAFGPRPPMQPPMVTELVAVPPPPAEIAALAKQIAGAYACKGVELASDGSSTPLAGKLAVKLALGGAWLASSFAEPGAGGLQLDDYRGYDPVAQQWTRVQLASTGDRVIATSLGEKGGTWTWEGTSTSATGTTQVRDYEQVHARQLKLWGEALLGGGWQKRYEISCRR